MRRKRPQAKLKLQLPDCKPLSCLQAQTWPFMAYFANASRPPRKQEIMF